MTDKFTALTADLHHYLVAHSSFRDPASLELEAAADEMGDLAQMQIAGDQAAFMTVLTASIGARRALEVGTFLGYGAVAISRGLPADGELICCELEQDYADRAQAALARAGVADRVTFRIGPAIESLREMPTEPAFDLAFVDADKTSYPLYVEEILPRLHPNGLLVLDNVLMGGRVLEQPDESSRVIARLNDDLVADDRVEVAMVGIADGLTIARKL